jgi:hypothetical protein
MKRSMSLVSGTVSTTPMNGGYRLVFDAMDNYGNDVDFTLDNFPEYAPKPFGLGYRSFSSKPAAYSVNAEKVYSEGQFISREAVIVKEKPQHAGLVK